MTFKVGTDIENQTYKLIKEHKQNIENQTNKIDNKNNQNINKLIKENEQNTDKLIKSTQNQTIFNYVVGTIGILGFCMISYTFIIEFII